MASKPSKTKNVTPKRCLYSPSKIKLALDAIHFPDLKQSGRQLKSIFPDVVDVFEKF